MRAQWGLLPAILLVTAVGCQPSRPGVAPSTATTEPGPFTDVAAGYGVDFQHRSGATERHHLPETMGSGCAFFDYDNDGWTDVFLIQAGELTRPVGESAEGNRLFRNEGGKRFRLVPDAAGLADSGYGMGCCAADIDNDGDLDVLVTTFTGARLYRNVKGRFRDVTAEAGVNLSGWCASAAFGDFDNDGWIDLFVSRYVKYDPATAPPCSAPGGTFGYCPPEVFPPTTDFLLRNVGQGRFKDVSRFAGIHSEATRGLGVEWVDFNRDGLADIFVACDQSPNVLWQNLGNGKFKNVAVTLGAALGPAGQTMNGMGVDFADPDHDGDPDGVVTNFSGQPNSYLENVGRGGFLFRADESGLGKPSMNLLGFGCNFLDYDGDGWEDLFVANGHVNDRIAEAVPGISYAEPASLYRNTGDGKFEEQSGSPGSSIWRSRVSRGSAVGDFNQDGAVDLLVSNCNDHAELFRNNVSAGNRWIALHLEGTRSNRSAIGARITLCANGVTQTREVRAGSSYLSQNELTQTFGLGKSQQAEEILVRWPRGAQTRLKNVAGGTRLTLREP